METTLEGQVVGGKLHVDGYIYVRSRVAKSKTYWDCRQVRSGTCKARAITTESAAAGKVTILKGPKESSHVHPPDREEASADAFTQKLKEDAAAHPDRAPSHLLRDALTNVDAGVLSQLPEQNSLLRTIRRKRQQSVPQAPRKLSHLRQLPADLELSLTGERFLLFDSHPCDDDYDDDEDDFVIEEEQVEDTGSRVLVFATRRNIELLCQSPTWFVDGTFKVSPSIFTQVFTIMGLVERRNQLGETVALPLVYALLPGKRTELYEEVLRAVRGAVERYRIHACVPLKIVSDFE